MIQLLCKVKTEQLLVLLTSIPVRWLLAHVVLTLVATSLLQENRFPPVLFFCPSASSSPVQKNVFFLALSFNCSSFISHLESTALGLSMLNPVPTQYRVVSECSPSGAGSLSSGRERPGVTHTNTHTSDENLWRGLSHHCPLSLSTRSLQTDSFTLLHHQTSFCPPRLPAQLPQSHTYLHTSACKLISASKTKCPSSSGQLSTSSSVALLRVFILEDKKKYQQLKGTYLFTWHLRLYILEKFSKSAKTQLFNLHNICPYYR